jgi:hypothetical protein
VGFAAEFSPAFGGAGLVILALSQELGRIAAVYPRPCNEAEQGNQGAAQFNMTNKGFLTCE